jgi:hypothetical protein
MRFRKFSLPGCYSIPLLQLPVPSTAHVLVRVLVREKIDPGTFVQAAAASPPAMDRTGERPAPIDPQADGPQTPTASPTVDALRRSLESPSTVFSSPRRAIVYSDRFIPSRATNSRLDFSVLDRERAAHESPGQHEREDANPAYRNMLRQTLLGYALPTWYLLVWRTAMLSLTPCGAADHPSRPRQTSLHSTVRLLDLQ